MSTMKLRADFIELKALVETLENRVAFLEMQNAPKPKDAGAKKVKLVAKGETANA